jgi:hypothetical protein
MNQQASRSVETMKKMTDDIVVNNDELNQKFSKLHTGSITLLNSYAYRWAKATLRRIKWNWGYCEQIRNCSISAGCVHDKIRGEN